MRSYACNLFDATALEEIEMGAQDMQGSVTPVILHLRMKEAAVFPAVRTQIDILGGYNRETT